MSLSRSNPTATAGEPPAASRWLLLLAASLTAVLIPLCFTGPAVVLSAISHDVGGSAVALSWVVNGYVLAYGGAMMAAGSLADVHGRKRLWLLGLVLFAAVTLTIPLAPSVFWIDVLRLVQGVGGSAAFAAAMAALAQVFHGELRNRVFSLLGTTFGVGLAFGPLLAGWLTDGIGWRWAFLLPALSSLAAIVLVWRCARETRDPAAQGLDWPGALSFTAALSAFTYGLLLAPERGWGDAGVLAWLFASLALLMLFVRIERRVPRPMLDLSLFRQWRFVGVQFLAASPAFAYVVLIVLLPGRFIGIEGQSALQAGWTMLALSAPLLVVPFLAALLARRFSAGGLSAFGLLLAAAGLLWLAQAFAHGNALMGPLLCIGIGIGLPWGLMDALAVSVVAPERAGMATGIFNTVRVSGDGVAIAVVGALLATLVAAQLQPLGLDAAQRLAVANQLAIGNLAGATAEVGANAQGLLREAYSLAFGRVLQWIAGVTVLVALTVFVLLARAPQPTAQVAPAEA
ncbi:MAG: Multidrug resistance protein Stp [Stenotrophomonas maltophilia]|nr:MAG: Multidrug resistance protein Stp [Stenotrophomonas maltophilia]